MNESRREFLKGTAWMGVLAAAGCATSKPLAGTGGNMAGFRCDPLKCVRVGFIGLGSRGAGAPRRVARIPGVKVVGLCDIRREAVEESQAWFEKNGFRKPQGYFGSAEAYRQMIARDDLDVVYIATDWQSHAALTLQSLRAGKHTFTEVPSAMTIDECWEIVETAEKVRRHCMQLENGCYGESVMAEFVIARKGLLGELTHADGSYIHDLTEFNHNRKNGSTYRLDWDRQHTGDQYPTHDVVPLMQMLNVNRGDAFDYLVSMGSTQACYEHYERTHYPEGHSKRGKVLMPDVTTTLVKTLSGKSITLVHDVSTPRPHSVQRAIMGTGGYFSRDPDLCYLYDPKFRGAGSHKPMSAEEYAGMLETYRHPLWRTCREIAKKVGGHGGGDFLMDLRWVYCLQNGLPLDQDVYDLASSCAICELSERSCLTGSLPQKFPDFTRGGWKTAKPLDIVSVDPVKMGLRLDENVKDNAQLSV